MPTPFIIKSPTHVADDFALASMSSPARLLLNVILTFAAAAAATTYDYVIVGGGATGLSLGVRLSEDSTKAVVVLEAGARYVYICVVFLSILKVLVQWHRKVTRP
jgi:hypothetical protein